MTTVYVVTSGEYSDYRIDGVFSTQEAAAARVKLKKIHSVYSSTYHVEPWPLDAQTEDGPVTVWEAICDLKSGALSEGKPQQMLRSECESYNSLRSGIGPHWAWGRSAESQEHANKLAVEARQARLRGER